MKKIISLILVSSMIFCLWGCLPQKSDVLTLTKMNTVMQITVFSTSKGSNKEFLDKVSECINKMDLTFDANNENSDVYSINNAKGNTVIKKETANIINKSIEASRLTDGAFDITIMPVLKLWGFDDGKYGVPKKEAINKAKEYVDYSKISVKGNNFTAPRGTQIALGGIAKGYLGDQILKIADEYGARAIVSLGGNIVLCGSKNKDEKWDVGIKNPNSSNSLACSFKCDGGKSVVTSGGYERYFEYGGKTYHHIIDPKTGYSAESDLKSVTVIGKDGAFCDAFSTALFVMGREKATEFINKHSDFDFILITDKNEVLHTENIKGLTVKDKNFTVKSIEK